MASTKFYPQNYDTCGILRAPADRPKAQSLQGTSRRMKFLRALTDMLGGNTHDRMVACHVSRDGCDLVSINRSANVCCKARFWTRMWCWIRLWPPAAHQKNSLDFSHPCWVTFATSSIILYQLVITYHKEHLTDLIVRCEKSYMTI
jgi:hypothetical protein